MDFGLNEEQEAVRDLARRILGDRTTPERLKQLEGGEDPFDRSTWGELGEAGLLGEIIGPQTYLKRGSPEAVLKGKIEQLYRSLLILTFGGGVNEVQRDLIAMFGLGLPRSR